MSNSVPLDSNVGGTHWKSLALHRGWDRFPAHDSRCWQRLQSHYQARTREGGDRDDNWHSRIEPKPPACNDGWLIRRLVKENNPSEDLFKVPRVIRVSGEWIFAQQIDVHVDPFHTISYCPDPVRFLSAFAPRAFRKRAWARDKRDSAAFTPMPSVIEISRAVSPSQW